MPASDATPGVLPEEERQIRAVLERLFDAWARGDGEAYAGCFTENCDYITFNGMHLHGRHENASLHGALFRTVLRGSRLSADILAIELLAPGVAVVHTAGRGRRRSFQTYVLTKASGAWLVRSFQNTRVQPFSIWLTRRMQR